jgi:hypothetical protein
LFPDPPLMSVPLRIHLYVAPDGLAVSVVFPPVQKDVAPEIDTTGLAFIVAVTVVLEVDKHPVVVFLACA